jgi:5'-nucleotidase
MSTKKRILFDMDGILVNLLHHWLKVYNEENDDDLRMKDIKTWAMHHHTKPDSNIYDIPRRPGFFENAPPMPGAIAAYRAIKKHGHEVLICSSPYLSSHYLSAAEKHKWCARYLNTNIGDVMLTHHKDWVNCDVIIDDKPETILEFAEQGKEVITIAYPYNHSVEEHCALRAQNMLKPQEAWEEITEYLT